MAYRRSRKKVIIREVPEKIIVKEVPVLGKHQDKGVLHLNKGTHSITVETKREPEKIWVSFKEEDIAIPVCHGDVDRVGVTMTPEGFVVEAEIFTDTRTIEWLAELTPIRKRRRRRRR